MTNALDFFTILSLFAKFMRLIFLSLLSFHGFVKDQKYNCVISIVYNVLTSLSSKDAIIFFWSTIKSNRMQLPNPMIVNEWHIYLLIFKQNLAAPKCKLEFFSWVIRLGFGNCIYYVITHKISFIIIFSRKLRNMFVKMRPLLSLSCWDFFMGEWRRRHA